MKKILMMLLFITVLGSLLTLTLVAVNYFTEERIIKNEMLSLKKSVLQALDIPFSKADPEAVFAAQVEEVPVKDIPFYISANGNIAFKFSGSGLWGPITGIIALAPDTVHIKGIAFIHQEETPGLGSRITEKAYLGTYLDKSFTPALTIKGTPGAGAETTVDSITGATMSSVALVNILNANYQNMTSLLKEIKHGG